MPSNHPDENSIFQGTDRALAADVDGCVVMLALDRALECDPLIDELG